MSTITTAFQRINLADVRDITVSDILDDSGQKVRAIKFFGDPVVNGAPTPLLDLYAYSADPEDLKVVVPVSEF
jgi:hypothetical protein